MNRTDRHIGEQLALLRGIHAEIAGRVDERLSLFRRIQEHGSARDIFIELAFCILTPQSKARQCDRALRGLIERGLLFNGSYDELRAALNLVRFRNHKAEYLILARDRFIRGRDITLKRELMSRESVNEKREWLARTIKGMGIKEASHFLRNIGFGSEVAILDRHILKNLVLLGVINEMPKSLSPKRYLEIERLMKEFSLFAAIPLDHLDFVLWYRETGDIFK